MKKWKFSAHPTSYPSLWRPTQDDVYCPIKPQTRIIEILLCVYYWPNKVSSKTSIDHETAFNSNITKSYKLQSVCASSFMNLLPWNFAKIYSRYIHNLRILNSNAGWIFWGGIWNTLLSAALAGCWGLTLSAALHRAFREWFSFLYSVHTRCMDHSFQ